MKGGLLLPILSPRDLKELPEKVISLLSYIGGNSSLGEDLFKKETQSLSVFHVRNICAKPFHAHFFEALTA